MGANSKIEWTHHTFNPWRGCTKVSDGCKFCYALDLSKRNPSTLGVWGPKGTRVVAAESYWKQPLKWDAAAREAGERHRVFCASLADVFEGDETMPTEAWPKVREARARLFDLIGTTPHLDWLLLTKRPQHITSLLIDIAHPPALPRNVWIGTSVENQAAADERIPHLLKVPARVRFLSCEPLLGPVDLSEYLNCQKYLHGQVVPCTCPRIHWVIAGGESGGNARPMHTAWARGLLDQCQAAGVPFLFKQWGEYVGGTGAKNSFIYLQNETSRVGGVKTLDWGEGYISERVGKHAAGRLLDGREWNEMPL